MARKKLNPDGTLLSFGGDQVRLERGLDRPDRDAESVWILYERQDVKDDPDTTYDYRFEEVDRFTETEPGEPPEHAIEAAENLAAKE